MSVNSSTNTPFNIALKNSVYSAIEFSPTFQDDNFFNLKEAQTGVTKAAKIIIGKDLLKIQYLVSDDIQSLRFQIIPTPLTKRDLEIFKFCINELTDLNTHIKDETSENKKNHPKHQMELTEEDKKRKEQESKAISGLTLEFNHWKMIMRKYLSGNKTKLEYKRYLLELPKENKICLAHGAAGESDRETVNILQWKYRNLEDAKLDNLYQKIIQFTGSLIHAISIAKHETSKPNQDIPAMLQSHTGCVSLKEPEAVSSQNDFHSLKKMKIKHLLS